MINKVLFILILTASLLLVLFYFIPAFRGDIAVDSGFTISGLTIHYYGIIIAGAILVSFGLALRFADRLGISTSQIENALCWVLIFGLAGARLYFVAFSWQYFGTHLAEIFQIWKGGLSIYGGIIGGALGLLVYVKKNKLPAWNFFDLAVLVLPLAQALGRFGNFFNEEAFGKPTDLPWKLYISPAHRPHELLLERYFHPTFLYESLWNLLTFFVLWQILKNIHPSLTPSPSRGGKQEINSSPPVGEARWGGGLLLGYYLVVYSIGRFLIETLRLDSFFWQGLRIDQITALGMILIGLFIIFWRRETKIRQ